MPTALPSGISRSQLLEETRTLLRLAGPVMVAQLAQTANGFVDTLMAGQAGAADLAAVALGTSLWLPLYLFIVGIMTSTSAIVSHLFGAGRTSDIGQAVHQAAWIALPLGIVSFLLLRHPLPLLQALDVTPELIPLTLRYLQGISWGFPAICLFLALRFFVEGIGQPKPVMVVSVLGLLANIPLNYVFIYGKLGAPAMGGPGCGAATAIVMWLMLLGIALYARLIDHQFDTGLGWHPGKANPAQILEMLKLGIPIGLSIFFEVSVFCVIALLLASLGTTVIAGHQVALNVSSLLFMIPLSLSLAFGVRMGHCVGSRDRLALENVAVAGMVLVTIIATINAVVMALARHSIATLYTNDVEVITLASQLLLFAALFQLSDGLQVGAAGALRGLKDTRYPMVITWISYWGVALVLGYGLAFGHFGQLPMGAQGFWTGLLAGLSCAAVLLNLRLYTRIQQLRYTLAT